jgi:hypothetical protein
MTLLLGGALAACGGADGSQAAEEGAAPAPVLQEGSVQLANATIRVYKAPD